MNSEPIQVLKKELFSDRITLAATVRMDKNENFDALFTPALSAVWTPDPKNIVRFSFSSAIRNPTLTDQYLNLNVGRATLLGNFIWLQRLGNHRIV